MPNIQMMETNEVPGDYFEEQCITNTHIMLEIFIEVTIHTCCKSL